MLLKKWILIIAMGTLTLAVSSPCPSWSESGNSAPPASSMKEGTATSAMAPSLTTALDEGDYLIGPGDILDISVWKDEVLTRSCVVRPDGFISFPLIGDIPAAGKTTLQLKGEMEGKLSRYVPDVTMFLDIKQINSLMIFVIGKVNAPGRFVMNTNVNVLQALATAQGCNPFAKRNKIKILRQGKNGTTSFDFNYDEVVDGKRLEQNIRLQRGDVVVIP